jgi:phosphomevalonate kinase
MTALTASAPGKVVLCGEYAVLDGAPAISMAVDRRALVTLIPVSGNGGTVKSIGHVAGSDRSLFDSAVRAAQFERADDFSFVLDTSEFVDAGSGEKFGIGSSAALMVAMCRALAPDDSSDREIGTIAARAHWDFQGGAGSGVDIATSATGGLIEFRMADTGVTKLSWPAGLSFALLWSGVPASTRERVDRLLAGVEQPSRKALADSATIAAAAWQSGDAAAIIATCGEYTAALMKFSIDHGLGIFEAGHDALVEHAYADGLVYKPCGAGGGDIGIVLATDTAQLNAFVERAGESGFRHLDFDIDMTGVQITREHE